jgi:HTH-type transcriptional regulator / antitoxin MqsA
MFNIDTCPVCASNEIAKRQIEQIFQYKGQSLVVPEYVVFECANCGESFPDEEMVKDLEPVIRDFHRKSDGLFTSEKIRKIRKGLGFTQEQFGEILGGGTKAFARYENGSVTQSKPMDNLLKIVWRFPGAIELLKEGEPNNVVKISMPRINYQSDPLSEETYKLNMSGT